LAAYYSAVLQVNLAYVFPLCFIPPLVLKESLWRVLGTDFYGLNEQCYGIEGNSSHWPKPVAWAPFFICQSQTPKWRFWIENDSWLLKTSD